MSGPNRSDRAAMLLGNLVAIVCAVAAFQRGELTALEAAGVAFLLSLLVAGLVRACAWVRGD